MKVIYGSLSGEHSSSGIAPRAEARRAAILGSGPLGGRAEFLLQRLAQEACEPSTLLAMGVAGGIFRMTRLATLSRLSAGNSAGIFSRGLIARSAATLSGFALEAPTFTLTARLASEGLGRPQDWSSRSLGRDIASSYLVLGGLRAVGALTGSALQGLPRRVQELAPLRFIANQGGMFGGIVLGHWLETRAGLRAPVPGATTLTDSLALLLQFNVGGRLSHAAFGENVARWERVLDAQSELLGRHEPPRRPALSLAPELALAAEGPNPPFNGDSAVSDRIRGMGILMMSGFKDREGPFSSSSGTRPKMQTTDLEGEVDFFFRGEENPERGLQHFIDNLPLAAAVANINGEDGFGRIFLINRRFTELFGYNQRQAGEHPITHFFSLKSMPLIAARIWTIVRGGVFQATKMEFLAQNGEFRKIWGSGVVRNVYGKNYAFGFYEPRDENADRQPTVLPALKAFQAAEATRPLEPDRGGYLELRSTLELSMQLTNPTSSLVQKIIAGDVRIRVVAPANYSFQNYSETIVPALNLLHRRHNIPDGRQITMELTDSANVRRDTLQLTKRQGIFVATGSGANGGSSPQVFSGTFGPNPGSIPSSRPPIRRTGLFAEVSRALGGIRTPESPANREPQTPDDGKKKPGR
ncbi:MAG: PAS domain-containing protein [Deltaproteobacteria bacterium]|nr:PAS domain-containing protein [Deltaproteobacteria bacterium]